MPRHSLCLAVCATCLATFAPLMFAQSSISPVYKSAWTENCGWTNWRDANTAASGVRVQGSVLAGWTWSENLGWITVGDGTPTNGVTYANATGTDFGVNLDANGTLAGLAWSENAGWINFGPLSSLPASQQARYDSNTYRFHGYAWGENIGWLNLDDAHAFVSNCIADFDGSGKVDADDIFNFLDLWFDSDPRADIDSTASVNADDIFVFLNAWFAGCA